MMYLVKWEGYKEPSMEPEENLADCIRVDEYWKALKVQAEKRTANAKKSTQKAEAAAGVNRDKNKKSTPPLYSASVAFVNFSDCFFIFL
jgi:hypothetical protein